MLERFDFYVDQLVFMIQFLLILGDYVIDMCCGIYKGFSDNVIGVFKQRYIYK